MDVVHINTATCRQLLTLPGVGSRVARAITDRRAMLGGLAVADLETIPRLRLTPYLLARIDFSPPSGTYDWCDSDPDFNGRVANYHGPRASAQLGSDYGDGQGEDRGAWSSYVSSCLTESSRHTQQWEGPVVDSKSWQDSNQGQRGDSSLRYSDRFSGTDTFNNSCVGDGQIREECLDYSRMSRIMESSPNYSRMSGMEYHSPDYFSQTIGTSPGYACNQISGIYITSQSVGSVRYTPYGIRKARGSVQFSPGGTQQSVGSVPSLPGGTQQTVWSVPSLPWEIEMVGGRGVLYPNMAQGMHNIQYSIHQGHSPYQPMDGTELCHGLDSHWSLNVKGSIGADDWSRRMTQASQ